MDHALAFDPGRFIHTPHPVLLDGQRNLECDLRPGESLYTFLSRHVDLTQRWEVCIGGVVVPVEHWTRIYPKHGQVIECRAAVGKSVLALVATLALIYFTGGVWSLATSSFFGGFSVGLAATAAGIYVAGPAILNRVQPQ